MVGERVVVKVLRKFLVLIEGLDIAIGRTVEYGGLITPTAHGAALPLSSLPPYST